MEGQVEIRRVREENERSQTTGLRLMMMQYGNDRLCG